MKDLLTSHFIILFITMSSNHKNNQDSQNSQAPPSFPLRTHGNDARAPILQSSTKKPLPAPPKFDPSSIKVPKSSTAVRSKGVVDASSLSSKTLDLNLPKPPPLPLPRKTVPSSAIHNHVASESIESKSFDSNNIYKSKEEEEHVKGSLGKIPLDGSLSKSELSNNGKLSQVHSTVEILPKLESAPPSFTFSAKHDQSEPSMPVNSTRVVNVERASRTDTSEVPEIPHHPKRIVNNLQRPKNGFLTESQRSLPILVVPTKNAAHIAAKNNLTLSEMLNGLGNSMAKYSTSMLGKLAPIRSVNRMINLRWDMISLLFLEKFGYLDGQFEENVDVGSEWEERLNFVSGTWTGEQDLLSLENSIESIFYSSSGSGRDTKTTQNADAAAATTTFSKNDATAFINSNDTPWFARFRNGINQQTSHQKFSLLHAPLAVLYVATSKEGIIGLEGLLTRESKSRLPEEFTNRLFDTNAMKEQFLILHDEQDDSIDEDSFNEGKLIQDMRNRFGPGRVAFVRVNGIGMEESVDATEEDKIWDEFLPPEAPRSYLDFVRNVHKIRGGLLSNKDKHALRAFIAQMVTTVLIPSLERRIYELNVEVTNHKKGVRNVLKSFWRKPKDSLGSNLSLHGVGSANEHSKSDNGISMTGGSLNKISYSFDTIENQTRLLADTLFLIRDYDEALAMYRLVKDDYRHDQNTIHNASVHEMMALSMYLSDLSSGYRNTREIVQYIDSALALYSSAAEEDRLKNGGNRPLVAPIATRCVTRLCILLSSTRALCQGREMETADCLASASSKETPLGAAVLLEQSSVHYHRAGMRRKFAFHILMAGHMFRSAGQDHHAIRCFTSALCVYHEGERYWPELFNHLTSALAGQLYAMKRMQLSLQLYAKLVGTTGGGRVSVRSQQKFLDHLVNICRSYRTDALESSRRMKNIYHGYDAKINKEVEEVIKNTQGIIQILEIPNMNLPKILDSSISVQNASVSSGKSSHKDHATFGKQYKGDELIWQDMKCTAEAEVLVHSVSEVKQSPNNFVNAVIDELEKERKKMQLQSRTKKSLSSNDTPYARAKLEPLSVSFEVSNPLSVMVPISSMQLVGKLNCSTSHRVYTNIEALSFSEKIDVGKPSKKWKFSGSDKTFEIADFSRISPSTDSDFDSSWQCGVSDTIEPYFLVTKGKMAMEPRSTVLVSLELCPLVMGELEIVGVRCKVFNEIWVYHKFNAPRHLLNGPNRLKRLDVSTSGLSFQIGCNMPNIQAEILTHSPTTKEMRLLQGQVSKWYLRLSNIGAAHATNLYLKTNLPWVNVLDEAGKELAASEPVPHCIGPSGTMFRLPLPHSSSRQSDSLGPGQTIDIPIEIRTYGGGKKDFYMLFRYELCEKLTASNISVACPKIRWLRKMSSVAVYPSLTLTSSITPFPNKTGFILSVEATNYRSDSQNDNNIVLDKMCILSKNFVIKPLIPHPGNSTANENLFEKKKMAWQEQSVMHFIITQAESKPCDSSLHKCLLGQSNSESMIQSSITDYVCLEHAHDDLSSRLVRRKIELERLEAEQEKENQGPRSIAQIRRARSLLSSKSFDGDTDLINSGQNFVHPTSLSSLCSTNELNIICCWKTKDDDDDVIEGWHHMRQSVRSNCPLLISAKFHPHVTHNFSLGPLHLQIMISIHNSSSDSVNFKFSMDPIPGLAITGTDAFSSSLKGGDGMVFPLELIIFRAGVYNLQSTKLTVHDQSKNADVAYSVTHQWILRVNA